MSDVAGSVFLRTMAAIAPPEVTDSSGISTETLSGLERSPYTLKLAARGTVFWVQLLVRSEDSLRSFLLGELVIARLAVDGLSSVGDIEEMVYIPSGSSTGLDDFERFYKLVRCLRW